MHTRSHISILRQSIWLALILAIGAGIVAFFFATQKPTGYTAVVSFDVVFINRVPTAQDQYGAYYDLKAAEIFTQNAMSWMMTPAAVAAVYDAAAVEYSVDSLSQFTTRFQTKQYGAQNFIVQFTEADHDRAFTLSAAVAKVMQEKANETSGSNGTASFELRAADPIVVKEQWDPVLLVVIAALTGLCAGVVLTYGREYLRSEHQNA